jgi:hypothetical protein
MSNVGAYGMSAEEMVGAEDMEGAWGGDDDLGLDLGGGAVGGGMDDDALPGDAAAGSDVRR